MIKKKHNNQIADIYLYILYKNIFSSLIIKFLDLNKQK